MLVRLGRTLLEHGLPSLVRHAIDNLSSLFLAERHALSSGSFLVQFARQLRQKPASSMRSAGACSFCATPGSKSLRSVSGQGTRSTLSGLPKWRDMVMDELILLIVFLFAALPTLPYSASGRTAPSCCRTGTRRLIPGR